MATTIVSIQGKTVFHHKLSCYPPPWPLHPDFCLNAKRKQYSCFVTKIWPDNIQIWLILTIQQTHFNPRLCRMGPKAHVSPVRASIQYKPVSIDRLLYCEIIRRNRHNRTMALLKKKKKKTASALEKMCILWWMLRLKLFVSIVLLPLICSFLWVMCLLFIWLYNPFQSQHALKCVN